MVYFARRILTTCWDGILDILSILISGRSACGVNGSLALMFNAKEESRRARQAICTSLEGLKTAAMLSSVLGEQLFLPGHFFILPKVVKLL
jgi:brefeldin A-inhibited guanine nucleotide-exchange protein 3